MQARQQARQKIRQKTSQKFSQKSRQSMKATEYSGEAEKANLLKDQAKQSKQDQGRQQKPANSEEYRGRRGMKNANATNRNKIKKAK